LGPSDFACNAFLDWGLGHLEAVFACGKAVFWLSSLYQGNKGFDFCHSRVLDAKIVIWQAVNS
jgi:hypothetical protein